MSNAHARDSQDSLADQLPGQWVDVEQSKGPASPVARSSPLPFFVGVLPRLRGYRWVAFAPVEEDIDDGEPKGLKQMWRNGKKDIWLRVSLYFTLLALIFPFIVWWITSVARQRHPSVKFHLDFPQGCVERVPWSFGTDTTPAPSEFLGSSYLYTANVSLSLPSDADVLSIITRGNEANRAHGIVEFIVDDGTRYGQDSDVHVEFTAFMNDRESLQESATICRLHPSAKHDGAGLVVNYPRYQSHRSRRMVFAIKVYFPTSPGSPTLLNQFRTSLPQFIHKIGDLQDHVSFLSLSLWSTNHPVYAESVSGKNINVMTSNAPIKGTFNATSILNLYTQNALIDVNVSLVAAESVHSATAMLKTTNAPVSANMSLLASAREARFNTQFETSNGALDVAFAEAPVSSLLDVRAHTSNAPARVSLHETFEGTFDLFSTTWHQPQVHVRPDVEDPEGQGRRRVVEIRPESRESSVSGSVAWGKHDGWRRYGRVNVASSNNDVRLHM
ncbi:uncharacterized protein FIBRA_06559 [Fibroporia radiculosa]|uniref:Uncharacterized protein n=1 Tax=Fibroporia radiculosa TaxID=599839 RepID=J4H451_9APHY|nr:uncharacterized protein FIBRA_06559 [Fibroporia radiculosa]CCM04384.1 predicted protein [Fibroporia radiculosa]